MSYELMANKDLRLEMDFDQYEATKFLKAYGRWLGNKRFIPRREFRRLQLDGTVAEFMRRLGHEVRADRRSD